MIGGVWAITVVRDEADVVGFAIDHLIEQGVSRVLAVDHRSVDATPELLSRRRDSVTVVRYGSRAFAQGTIMTTLARHAARFGAEWIIPFDCDEVWWTRDGTSLSEFLLACSDDAVAAECWNFLPTSSDIGDENPFRRITHREDKPTPWWSKVAFRADPRIFVLEGNHGVSPPRAVGSGLVIAHYPYRNRDQLERKFRHHASGRIAAGQPRLAYEVAALDTMDFPEVWDDFITTHRLPGDWWQAPESLVEDPEIQSIRLR